MTFIRTIFGAAVGAALILFVSKAIPFTPDLSDWGGRAYPQSYLLPLIILAIVGYISGWIGAKLSPETGRLTGMLASIAAGAVIIGWKFDAPILRPLFHHPAYPVFSDHALLALAVLLACGHLGGMRVEKGHASRIAKASQPEITSTAKSFLP
jgi:uncharacterized membrane protein YeaQ/YmgE (transglycosylase-associated protein family)